MTEEDSDIELEEVVNIVHRWGIEFSKSRYFKELTKEQKCRSEAVIMLFTQYMYSYYELSPEEWDEESAEECCLEEFPRKISDDESFFRAVAPVLSAFFTFLSDNGILRNVQSLAGRIKEINQQIIENALDHNNWGPAKSFVMAAKEAGVDIRDEKEMNMFMIYRGLKQVALMEGADISGEEKFKKFLTQKLGKFGGIGRNEPCPCGSGKKYKKCCAAGK